MELQQAARCSPVADDVKFSATWEANVRYFQDWARDTHRRPARLTRHNSTRFVPRLDRLR